MYIDNVKFSIKVLDSLVYEEKNIKAEILYQDETVLISNNNVYSRPHILIGTPGAYINYGYISFPELEIETRNGAIGLIRNVNDLEVTPSREAVIWSTKTRKAILDGYTTIIDTATNYVNDVLKKETDYLQWLIMSTGIRGGTIPQSAPLLKAFSAVISMHELKDFVFYPNARLSVPYVYTNKSNIRIRSITFDKYSKKIRRDNIKSISEIAGKPVYISNTPAANRYKDKFILEKENVDTYILINILENNLTDKETAICKGKSLQEYNFDIPGDKLQLIAAQFNSDDDADDDDADSTDNTLSSRVDHEAIRKLNKEIVLSVFNNGVFSSEDIKISELKNLPAMNKGAKIFYGTGIEREDMKDLGLIIPDEYIENSRGNFDLDTKYSYTTKNSRSNNLTRHIKTIGDIYMILVSQANKPYITDIPEIKHISSLIYRNYTDKGVLTFSNEMSIIFTFYIALKYLSDKYKVSISHLFTSNISESEFIYRYLGFNELISNDGGDTMGIYTAFNNTYAKSGMAYISTGLAQFLYNSTKYDFNKLVFGVKDPELLETINNTVPNSLAKYVDVITDVNIINKKLLKEFVYYLSIFALNKPILDLISFHYRYNKDHSQILKLLSNRLKLDLIRDIFEEVQQEHSTIN